MYSEAIDNVHFVGRHLLCIARTENLLACKTNFTGCIAEVIVLKEAYFS